MEIRSCKEFMEFKEFKEFRTIVCGNIFLQRFVLNSLNSLSPCLPVSLSPCLPKKIKYG